VDVEISPRAIVAIVLLLFGTTFLWLTPAFVGSGGKAEGTLWTVVQIISLLTVLGFAVAAYGLWRVALPWEGIAIGSAVVGLAATAAYGLAVRDLPGAANVVPNLVIHGVGSLVVLLVLFVPAAHSWLLDRL
jgi:hypothetical protein